MSNQLPRSILIISLILLAAVAFPAAGQQRRIPSNSLTQSSNDAATAVFRAARDLITDGEWARAQEKFRDYVNSYPNEKNLDAALYWLAYSQQKLSRYDECRTTLMRLLEKYPSTNWRDDARVLLAQLPGSVNAAVAAQAVAAQADAELVGTTRLATPVAPVAIARPVDDSIIYSAAPIATVPGVASNIGITPMPAQGIGVPGLYYVDSIGGGSDNDDDPCEFKIVVLQALFQTDLQRGIVAATDWLKQGSTQTVRCKGAALALLGRNGGKAVTPVILGVARNEPDVKLRARAISVLGATNDDTVIDPLREFALNSTDNEIVEASLYALSRHTGDRAVAVLGDIAVSGKSVSQRKMAIASIASRPGEPAVDSLLRIYDADQNVEIRKTVIAGFANRKSERAGNKLFDIARSADNIELRKAAIGGISRRGGDKSVEFLLSLYDSEKNEELKDQIINALATGSFALNSAVAAVSGQRVGYVTRDGHLNDQRVIQKMIEIARNQQAPMERRRRAIGWLSRSKDPSVIKFLEELLR
ncbi:MAG TPA: HEAT repeat domain-containing protein [Pyrinomonadaceae bacterium]|nr:HEAT repeat domain-containing protein [Pyrinomonadaceae bacterium]